MPIRDNSAKHAGPIQPGDLIAFRGNDLLSCGILLRTGSFPGFGYSHVAIYLGNGEIAESTSMAKRPCRWSGEHKSGVQVHLLADRVRDYHGRAWHFPLNVVGDEAQRRLRVSLRRRLLAEYVGERLDVPYDFIGAFHSRDGFVNWAREIVFKPREDLGKLYCSEFTVAAHRHLGVWDPPNASDWSPNEQIQTAVRTGIAQQAGRVAWAE